MCCCSLHLTICHSFSSLIAQVHTQITENDMSVKELQFCSPWPLLSDGPTSDHVYPCHQGWVYRIENLSNADISDFSVYRRVYRIEPPISSISIFSGAHQALIPNPGEGYKPEPGSGAYAVLKALNDEIPASLTKQELKLAASHYCRYSMKETGSTSAWKNNTSFEETVGA